MKLVDAASTAIVDAAAADVAEWLGFASFAEYQAATPDVREQRVTAMEIR